MSTGQAGAEIGIGIGTTLNCNHEAPIVYANNPVRDVAGCLNSAGGHSVSGNSIQDSDQGYLLPVAYSMITANTGANGLGVAAEVAPTLDRAQPCAVAFAQNQRDEVRTMEVAGALAGEPGMKQQTFVAHTFKIRGGCEGGGKGYLGQDDAAFTLSTAQDQQLMTPDMQVRRLTPRECERLQGFPDDYSQVPYRKKPAADGPRYKALGNSMAVPCMVWLGQRIQQVEDLTNAGVD